MSDEWDEITKQFESGDVGDRPTEDIVTDELTKVLAATGIRVLSAEMDEDGLSIGLGDMRDAELLMSLAFDGPAGPGSTYDRATSACVSFTKLVHEKGEDTSDDDLRAAVAGSWTWVVHPHLLKRLTRWHVNVILPADDALWLTARLNDIRNEGL